MSGKALGYVFDHSPYSGAMLLVHLAIADTVNDAHNDEFWMRNEALAKKAHVSRETAVRCLKQLCDEGHLQRLTPEGNPGRGKSVNYRFLVKKGDESSHFETVKGDEPSLGNVTVRRVKGDEPSQARTSTNSNGTELRTLSRQRDELFETVALVCGIDYHDLPDTARGALNRHVKQLRAVGATPTEVIHRAKNWPWDVPLTSGGLVNHWASLHTYRQPPAKDRASVLLREAMALREEEEP